MIRRFALLFCYLSAVCVFNGATPAAAVVGAGRVDAPDGVRRHTVAILFARGLCSGVLIAQDMIATAAHCFSNSKPRNVVALDRNFRPRFLVVADYAVHPSFRHASTPIQSSGIDLAVVRLAEPAPVDLAPASISSFSDRGDVFLAGFGVTNRQGDKAGTLRGAPLRARSVDWKAHRLIAAIGIDENGPKTGTGGCRGDSGGPLFDSQTGAVVALVSWSSGMPGQKQSCGGLTVGTVIGDHQAWIGQAVQSLRSGAASAPSAGFFAGRGQPAGPSTGMPDPARGN